MNRAQDQAEKSHFYRKSIAPYKGDISSAVPREELVSLHRRDATRHLLIAARQFALVAGCSVALWRLTHPLLWAPFAIVQGFTFFNMTVLLHEAVHQNVFQTRRDGWTRALGRLYAFTSGISAAQFTRWHLDHHDNLGSEEDDPKRHWLSPKRNARWYKLLYCTPALIVLYFRAAARETATYPPDVRGTIALERRTTMLLQLAIALALSLTGGFTAALKIQLIPYLFVFPVAFTLNRLGQHYDIDPSHPLKWTTWMKASRFWDFFFLYSNYHLEHHYFPNVPFYRLRRLHFLLKPFCLALGLEPHTYREIAWNWFVRNRQPHTHWAAEILQA